MFLKLSLGKDTDTIITDSRAPPNKKKLTLIKYGNQLIFQMYIYIYIVIHKQNISLYHNSSVWLDT